MPAEPTPREKIEACLIHLDRLIDLKGERVAVREMRKHTACYIKGLRGKTPIRDKVNQFETRDDVVKALNDYVDFLEGRKLAETSAL